MRRRIGLFIAVVGFAAAQEPRHSQGARELYYLAFSKKDVLPPIRKSARPPQPAKSGAVHLGLRYNLVLVDVGSGKSNPVDSERVLHRGECVGIDVESNHSGYLYVLAKQSSGAWEPLLPHPEMPNESNVVDPGKKLRAPSRLMRSPVLAWRISVPRLSPFRNSITRKG
jgi:hypothetical protein